MQGRRNVTLTVRYYTSELQSNLLFKLRPNVGLHIIEECTLYLRLYITADHWQ